MAAAAHHQVVHPVGLPLGPSVAGFGTDGIRGRVGTQVTPALALQVGYWCGQVLPPGGPVLIGMDSRSSGPMLVAALSAGLTAAGREVWNLGLCPTPAVPGAIRRLSASGGLMVSASHNPPHDNGIKVFGASGAKLSRAQQQVVEAGLAGVPGKASAAQGFSGVGLVRDRSDLLADYQRALVASVMGRRLEGCKIVLDLCWGSAAACGEAVFQALGADLTVLHGTADGERINVDCGSTHLDQLRQAVLDRGASMGFAFDGDGDRLGVVTKDGQIIYPDRQLMLFAEDVLSRNPGAQIIYDVKCSRKLAEHVRAKGGQPLMWKTGHSLVKAKLKETGAPLAGEMSGHIFFKERWYGFDDGLYAGARLLEILSRSADPSAVLNALPNSSSTPELQIKLQEGENFALIDKLLAQADFPQAKEVITIDGLRVEYADGFGLARSSNTTPVVVLRFEADNAEALARIQTDFRRVLLAAKPDLVLPF